MTATFYDVLGKARVVPVAVIDDVSAALRVAAVLEECSLPVIEITLRTASAIDCIRAIVKEFPGIFAGAGSVLSVDALRQAKAAGARFAVAPCLDPEVVECARGLGIPFIPGISTPSELNQALKLGCDLIKVFPAADLGGVKYINAITAPFKLQKFHLVPTGGINENNIADYFSIPRVIACGASYIVDGALVEKGDFETLRARIRNVVDGLAVSR